MCFPVKFVIFCIYSQTKSSCKGYVYSLRCDVLFLFKVLIQKTEFQSLLLTLEKDTNLLTEITNTPFFNQCVYLSWLMVVQEPPMHLDDGPGRRSYINRDRYQEFTKKGSIIDYCVWPAIFVEKEGPLAAKGVVQVY